MAKTKPVPDNRTEWSRDTEDPLAFRLLNEIGILNQLSTNRAARLLRPELNMSQFIVLNHFARLGGERSLVRLAKAMQVTKGAMTNSVSRLAEKGWLIVRPDPEDGRGKLVRLTGDGMAARSRAVLKLGEGLAGLESVVTADELALTLRTLCKLRLWFDERR
jgi:DNA-binding MarR family transcriptional regulator